MENGQAAIHAIARCIFVSAALMLCNGAATAGSISTPILFLGGTNQLVCIANNVGTTAVRVKVKIIGLNNTVSQSCKLGKNDAGGCQNFLNNESGYCVISNDALTDADLRAQVRGVMFTRSTSPPFAIEAVVQAQ
jgi:hypothetical protein